jgi:uncharacterized membrane protein YfcA
MRMTRSDDVVQDYEEDETMEENIMYPSSRRRRLWNRIWIVLGLSATGALLMTLATMAAAHQSSLHSEQQPEVAMYYYHRDRSISRSTSSRTNSFPVAASSSRLHSFLREQWNEYKTTKRRRLDENNAGGGGGAQQQDAQGNGNNNNNGKQQQQGDSNFYFDDFIQDDLVQDDDASGGGSYNHNNNVVDDFYAFEVDRTPHLLPLSSNTIFGFFIASLALSLGASSGTGGGGTITPIYILIIGLPIQVAVPIGAVTCLGGSLACTSLNLRRRHPLADRVLIDWDMILIMEPLALVGTLVGSLVHKVLSEKILVVLLVLLLSITAHTTLGKAMRMYHAENRYIRQLRKTHGKSSSTASIDGQHASAGGGKTGMAAKSPTYPKIQTWGTMDPAEAESLASDSLNQRNTSANNSLDLCSQRTLLVNNRNDNIDDSNNTSQEPHPPQTGSTGNGNHNGTPMSQRRQETARTRRLHDEEKEEILIENPDYITLRSELMEQEKFTPSTKIMALCGILFIIIFLSLMVGGGSYESPWDIQCNSTAFWVVHAIMVAFLIGTAWAAQTYVVARHEIKELVRFDYVHGDIKWDTRSAIIYPALFVTAGFFAGTLGIGGGGTFVYCCFLVLLLLLLVVNWSFSLCCCPLPSLFCFCLSCSGPQ